MFNRNAFKTSLIFLGILFLGIAIRMFDFEDDLFLKSDDHQETASVGCLQDSEIC